ncbi:MAG: hypothetical protein CO144_01610 [Candidatus Nealsonbacteria bacterium CG_4_9_14_3_um_filter_35_11]|uniref:Peptide chain release factor domain-containing protein n=2 Tax=Candidatus Nealsoniibacteriota TaxID=1817911 RepID=A0A2M7DAG1_9BACT|nr:MAG: hypothetical protein COV62_02155 [Candidatus Nealsonbacteria bacterium CG11_big_fil_rev_8_21_14_0_20_35_11]PIV45407.1 MAG: hypothetical protein COS24_02475 [Candidatus Nealsonbacteria bacterium CG02_land_8_20_14_3_00_34_20]PIW92673.1 MAG: hypothetical protein COZ88_00965 [Candidatus Nealsonbacteria bacterium CG_4_8_14_3_um_filter_34_13]PIZ90069.1 MAG: hypothetical protein COX88_00415 [Candidatus Nealsonbacteria bacterium CG_4_10_14_0_2_um_filter_35_20]PJA84469.1 MAG: hypothetical protei
MIEGEEKIKALIMEIRAGVGGEEAALFAADLFRMYLKYSQNRGWRLKVLNSNPTQLGGFKEMVLEVSGEGVSCLNQESGVHRVQRIPKTEKSGRIHTSTATVALLPKPKKTDIKISPSDIKIDSYKASGPGGQYVNKRMSAVRITHIPSGLVVTSQVERSLQQNKESALSILEARLFQKERKEMEEKLGERRKSQIGKAQREEKIRTYNFPQNRITDHRIKKSWHNLEEILDGNLSKIIKAFQKK